MNLLSQLSAACYGPIPYVPTSLRRCRIVLMLDLFVHIDGVLILSLADEFLMLLLLRSDTTID